MSTPASLESEGRPIAVAVVSWNTRELLDRCLQSLRPCADAGLAEVWVVDNASTDGSADLVRDRHPWVRLIASQANLGYGPAINEVAARTTSAWLAISNADISLRPGALEHLLAAGNSDDRAGVVAPRLVLPGGETQHSVWPFPDLAPTALGNLGPRVVPARLGDRFALRGMWNPDRARAVPWAIGAFLLIRRSAWDALGGFDGDQWMSAEDLDLGWRLRRAGWITRYEPRAVADHDESAATGQVWGDDLALHWQRCSYRWMVRRLGRPHAVAVGIMNLAGAAARLAFSVALSRRRPAAWGQRVAAQRRWTLVQLYAFAPRRVLDRYR